MKSSYELAMERLQKSAPSVKLNAEQKAKIAELESFYKARQAEREIAMREDIAKAMGDGNYGEVEALNMTLANEKRKIAEELEAKKEAVRAGRA